MKLDLTYINERLGLDLKEKDAKLLLERMGYGYNQGTVLIPAYRADILHQADLVEDIAIAYGYENFEEQIPKVATIGREDPLEVFQEKIRDLLIGLELLEVKNYHLLPAEDATIKMNSQTSPIPLLNSVSEHNHLRNSLYPSLLKNLEDNQHHEYPHNIFELGKIFSPDSKEETGIKETTMLAINICHEKADFTQIHQILEYLLASVGLVAKIKEFPHHSFIKGRAGKIMIDKETVGTIGEIAPQVLEHWHLTMPVVVLEIDVEKIFSFLE